MLRTNRRVTPGEQQSPKKLLPRRQERRDGKSSPLFACFARDFLGGPGALAVQKKGDAILLRVTRIFLPITLPTNAEPMNSDEQLPEDSAPTDELAPFSDEVGRPLIIRSEDLLQGRSEVWIEHREDMYRLRLTSSGKLYLTK